MGLGGLGGVSGGNPSPPARWPKQLHSALHAGHPNPHCRVRQLVHQAPPPATPHALGYHPTAARHVTDAGRTWS